MLTTNTDHCSFSLFDQFKDLHLSFSLKTAGDLRVQLPTESPFQEYVHSLGISADDVVLMNQVHEATVVDVDATDRGSLILGVDGLVTKEKNLFLGVRTADCVPVFVYDQKNGVIGVAHAGWKGIKSGVIEKLIENAMHLGAQVENMYIAIGPHIGVCCYQVLPERAQQFLPDYPQSIIKQEDKTYLDLGQIVYTKAHSLGIAPHHFDAPIACTSCQSDRYFSYRKDTKETFGEMVGLIGML